MGASRSAPLPFRPSTSAPPRTTRPARRAIAWTPPPAASRRLPPPPSRRCRRAQPRVPCLLCSAGGLRVQLAATDLPAEQPHPEGVFDSPRAVVSAEGASLVLACACRCMDVYGARWHAFDAQQGRTCALSCALSLWGEDGRPRSSARRVCATRVPFSLHISPLHKAAPARSARLT